MVHILRPALRFLDQFDAQTAGSMIAMQCIGCICECTCVTTGALGDVAQCWLCIQTVHALATPTHCCRGGHHAVIHLFEALLEGACRLSVRRAIKSAGTS